MSGLFKNPYAPVINVMGGIRVQTALQGISIPIVYGVTRIAPNLIWYNDFFAKPIKSGKKGFGSGGSGKKGGGEYDYGAAVMLGLCLGPIGGIGTVWNTQGNLPTQATTETYTVPGPGGSYTVTNEPTFLTNLGVTRADAYSVTVNDYGSPGTEILTGTQQTPMIEGGSGAGHYTRSGTNSATYNFFAADAGKTMTISYTYSPPFTSGGIPQDPITTVGFTLFNGALGQSPWSYLTSKHPSQAIGYSGLAYLATPVYDLGVGGVLPNLNLEVYGYMTNVFSVPPWFTFGPGHANGQGDVNPSDMLYDIFTNPIFGCGLAFSEIGSLTQYLNYCAVNGLFVSYAMDQERTAADWIKDILDATNSELVESGGLLTILPYGDSSQIGNGLQYTPATNPIYDLDEDSFIRSGTTPPIEITRPSVQDAYNSVRIEYLDRGNSYNPSMVEAQDLNAINLYKYRPEPTRQYHMFATQPPAALVSQLALSRLVYIRNQYKFKLPQSFILLDPMDLVTVPPALLGMSATLPAGDVAHPSLLDSGSGVWAVGITTGGLLTTTVSSGSTATLFLNDSSGGSWQIKVTTGGILFAVGVTAGVYPTSINLEDSSATAWGMAVTTAGILETAKIFELAPALPIRILTIDEQEDRTLDITAEEFPWGTAGNTLYPKQALLPGGPNAYAPPGSINSPVIFEALSRMNNQIGHTIWFGLSGANANWGGCRIWISMDGTNYQQIATAVGRTNMGVLTSNLANTPDPDTVDTFSVDLTESLGALQSYTAAETNVFASLCYIGGANPEFIAYETATLTAAYMYNLGTLLRRGAYGSAVAAHFSGAPFMFLDDTVEGYDYDVGLIGATVYFKFTSFNQSGLVEELLSDVTAYPYTVTGASIGLLTPAHSSYRPLTNPLTAHDAGTSATINVAAFSMRVPGMNDIPFGSGAISGLSYSTVYYVYFSDPGFLPESAPAYLSSTVKEDAISVPGYMFVGSILTPAQGAVDTTGNNDGGGGAQQGAISIGVLTVNSQTTTGNGTITNIGNITDGDQSTFGSLVINGNSGSNSASIVFTLQQGVLLSSRSKQVLLHVVRAVPTNSLSGTSGPTIYQIAVSSTGAAGPFSTLIDTQFVGHGTIARGEVVHTLWQSGLITPSPIFNAIQISVFDLSNPVSGTLEADIYDIWVEVIE